MNFFDSQERSRRKTRALLALMTLAVVAVVGCVTAIIAAATWLNTSPITAVPFTDWLLNHIAVVGWTAAGVTAFIGSASLYRIIVLRDGGGRIARELGGTLVTADEQDPLRRRLRNVVEEMAIASGMAVPETYVLEQEAGINAFAAGFAPEDAAIAVTRGTLETLDREELQGVVAHEFSHILNGDMRLNIKLMGPLYGILAIGLVGRMLLRGSRSSRGRRGNGMAAALAIGAGLSIVGYVGMLLGRLIKAGVSRQREYLADASAVQFTRQTRGIAGALKKIAGLTEGSAVRDADAEEVSHMLFASGFSSIAGLLASHPPLLKRIRAIEPSFTEVHFGELHTERANFANPGGNEQTRGFAGPHAAEALLTEPDAVINSIGQPSDGHIQAAQLLLAGIPPALRDALASPDRVLLLLPAMILHRDTDKRSLQLQILQRQMGAARTTIVGELHAELSKLGYPMRLPMLELALPRIKAQPATHIDFLAGLLDQLALSDNRLEVFEYAHLRIYRGYMQSARYPDGGRWRNLSNRKMTAAAMLLLQIFVSQTMSTDPLATQAFARGAACLGLTSVSYRPPQGDWSGAADRALDALNECIPRGRQEVVGALVTAALHDRQLSQREAELLRAFCMMLGCPLPPILNAG